MTLSVTSPPPRTASAARERRRRLKAVGEVRNGAGPVTDFVSDQSIWALLEKTHEDIELAVTAITQVPRPRWVAALLKEDA